jgi:polysaccharide export outer membrane protein
MKALFTLILLAGLAALPAARAQDDTPPLPKKTQVYRIIVNDWLTVRVYGEDDLTTKSRVDAQGTITCALIDKPVRVYGMTLEEAQHAIEAAYVNNRLLRHPEVVLTVGPYAPRKVNVTGHVKNQGQYDLDVETPTTLPEIITRAGGFDDTAKGTEVHVTRVLPDGTTKVWIFDVQSVLRGHAHKTSPAATFILEPNDLVNVPQRLI